MAHVSADASSAPPVSLREMVTSQDGAGEQDAHQAARTAERNNLWREAQALRKKYIQLGLWQGRTTESLATLFSKSPAKSFEGILNEKHQAFVFSSDLWHEGSEAWSKQHTLEASSVQPAFDFFKSQSKETSMVLVFDAGSRANRQLIEENFGDKVPGGGGLFEWIILYDTSSKTGMRTKRMRKVFAGSVRSETAFLRLLVPRVRLAVKPREDDYADEGVTTADLHMVGVPRPTKTPKILASEKARIFPDSKVPDTVKSSSVPLSLGFLCFLVGFLRR